MRGRLMTLAGAMLIALPALASPGEEDEDRGGGQLIFQIARVLASTPNLDAESHSALGSSMEFLFLQLKRSRTKAAAESLARTAVLRIDAGGGESRTEAILSKGPTMVPQLKKIAANDYQRLCTGAMATSCMSESDVAKYIATLTEALRRGRVVAN